MYGYKILAPVFRTVLRLSDTTANFTAAAVIFIGVSVAAFLAGRALTRMLRPTAWGTLNRAAGASMSGIWAVSWVTLVLLAINVIPAPAAVRRNVNESGLARTILREAPGAARSVARTDLRKVLQIFVPEDLRLSVHATTEFVRIPADEDALLKLVNQERARLGLRALLWDERLAGAARGHASDMYARGYFAHESTDGRSPGERLRRLGIAFRTTAENIALAPEVRHAHARMMRSAVHRIHILGGAFTRIGIGVMFGPQGVMVDEEFAS